MNQSESVRTRKLTLLAILTAIVAVLQLVASAIRLGPFSITLVLTPIIVGAAMCGIWAGAFLGFVFGLVVLLSGDAALFLAVSVPATVAIVLLKGTLSGLISGLVYRLLEKKSPLAAAICAGIASPAVNTGVFFLGVLLCFGDFAVEFATGTLGLDVGGAAEAIALGFIGVNFPVELAVNLVLASAIVMLVRNGRRILKLEP